MASHKDYLDYVLDLLSLCDSIRYRAMMGEYVIYYRGKVVAGVFDDRFMIKLTPSSDRLLPDSPREKPYPNAKDMILADTEDRELLRQIFDAVYSELPEKRERKRK